jgi:alanine racemase
MSIYTTPVLNINLKKLIDNYKQLMTMSTPAIPAAVVKDDAYGIGAKIVAQTLYKKTHCRHFFVAHAKEGADIRPYVPDATIYVLQGIGADTLSLFDRHNLVPVISSPEMLKFWQQYKLPNIKPAIQIETGLNRLGFRKEELEELFALYTQETDNDPAFAHPQFKTERKSVATDGIKCDAGSEFATVVYENGYIKEQINNHDRAFAHPQFKTERESVATDGIKCDAGSEFATAVYENGYIKEQINNHDRALAHPPHPQIKESDFCLVISHLSCADEQSHFMNYRQLENFIELKNKYFPNTMSSLSASDGVFLSTEFHFDMVRLGAAMYGINTAPYRENEMQNIIELKAPVLQVANTKKGDFIGYSATYKCPKEMKIAIVSIGYGDGIPRSLSNKGKVLFYEHGTPHLCPILGRVSMDNIICDVSSMQSIKAGDFGTIINNDYTVDDVAKDADTIAYELISRLGKNQRILKNYIDE